MQLGRRPEAGRHAAAEIPRGHGHPSPNIGGQSVAGGHGDGGGLDGLEAVVPSPAGCVVAVNSLRWDQLIMYPYVKQHEPIKAGKVRCFHFISF